MKEINLTQGQIALVDDADYVWLSAYKWHARRKPTTGRFYAVRRAHPAHILMHREILGLKRGDARQGDHIEPSETLNNQRTNLRTATPAQNNCNRGPQKNNKCGLKGVSWFAKKKKWRADIKVNGKTVYLGMFMSAEEAHAAYRLACTRFHGEFGRAA